MRYGICNFTLDSNIPLAELPHEAENEPCYRFRLFSAREAVDGSFDWFHYWRLPDNSAWLSFAKTPSAYLLRFPGMADFLISIPRQEIDCFPTPSTPPETIEHLLIDQVLPLVFNAYGAHVIHGSAVLTPDGAVAFLGETGRGKSTLATHFSLHGLPLLTDDYFVLEEDDGQLFVTPSYPGVRLWDDSISILFERDPVVAEVAHYTTKKRLEMKDVRLSYCTERVLLRRVYCLTASDDGDPASVTIAALSARSVFMELVAASFKLDITDRTALTKEFGELGRISRLPMFYQLSFPRDFSLLPDVRQAILDHLQEA